MPGSVLGTIHNPNMLHFKISWFFSLYGSYHFILVSKYLTPTSFSTPDLPLNSLSAGQPIKLHFTDTGELQRSTLPEELFQTTQLQQQNYGHSELLLRQWSKEKRGRNAELK